MNYFNSSEAPCHMRPPLRLRAAFACPSCSLLYATEAAHCQAPWFLSHCRADAGCRHARIDSQKRSGRQRRTAEGAANRTNVATIGYGRRVSPPRYAPAWRNRTGKIVSRREPYAGTGRPRPRLVPDSINASSSGMPVGSIGAERLESSASLGRNDVRVPGRNRRRSGRGLPSGSVAPH